jgi:protein-histidine pros-kinase
VYPADAVNLLVKFNILLILVFGSGLGAAAVISRQSLQADARAETVRQAALMMETMLSARNYTTKQIQPLLVKQQEHQRSFLPQTVPAFAATENFLHLQASYPDYAYKEATLNPTNLRDRAVDWETDIINTFRNRPKEVKELVGERDTPTGKSLYLARPIKANPPCLECHSTPAEAPPALVRHYGANNGFGWQEGEIIGAQIVSVPMAVPFKMADEAFQRLMIGLSAVFAASLVVLDLALLFTVVRPLRKISAMADQISLGQMDLPELSVRGKDEIAVLASSFTRMRRSLERALSMLEG